MGCQKPDTPSPLGSHQKWSRGKGKVQMSSHYLRGLAPAARTSDCSSCRERGKRVWGNWAQYGQDAGTPGRGRKAETNGSFFLDSTLFGKTQTNHQFTPTHLLLSEEGGSPETKRLRLGESSTISRSYAQAAHGLVVTPPDPKPSEATEQSKRKLSKTMNPSRPSSLLPATSPHPQPTRKDSRGQCMSVRHTQSFLSAKGLQNPSLEGGLLATPIEAWWPKVMAGIMWDW